MPFTLTMPKLSPTMEEGTITRWHKKVSDFVDAGDLLFEVATDKATVEYHALDSGYLRQIIVGDGGGAVVNQAVAVFTLKKDESIEGYKAEGVQLEKNEVPVAKKTPLAEESFESAPPLPQAFASFKQVVFTPEPPFAEDFGFQEPSDGRIKASPLAKRLAKEKKLDLSTLKGSGPGGRIVSADLAKAQSLSIVTFGHKAKPEKNAGSYHEEGLSPIRKVISQRLQEAKSSIPHFYVSVKVDAAPLMQTRDQLKSFEIKLTVNDFIVRASALALKKHKEINSGFNGATNSIVRFETIDISVAVSLDAGLITPIIRHADCKNIGEISVEMKALALKAKEGKLTPQEYKGGSFTISNLGMYGVVDFIAIINPPQAAILAVSGIQDVAIVKEGHIVPGKEMTLTLSGDHRVIDGALAAQFLNTLKSLLENPAVLVM